MKVYPKFYEIKEQKFDGEPGEFSGYLSVFNNVDSWGDMVMPGAFKKTLQENDRFPLLDDHDTKMVIGSFEAEEDKKGLFIKARLLLKIQRASDIYEAMKDGALKGLSIGFRTVKEKWESNIRKLLEIQLWEGSILTFQANPEALIQEIKTDGGPEEILKVIDILKGRKSLTDEQLRIVKKASIEINALIESNEPPKSTRIESVSPYASIIEGLERMKNKPHVHLFGKTIETLEQNL